jgi:hypothetical protein
MFSRRVLLGLVVVACVFGCADLKELLSLQQGLAREFETSAINVNVNNSAYLTVTFSNAPIADQPEAEQAAFARRVAEYVRDHYAHYDQLQSIQVGFASVKGVGITFTRTRVPYRFTPSELGPPQAPKATPAPKAAV